MPSHSRVVLGSVAALSFLMICLLGFHIGGDVLLNVGRYSPLLGAFIGGTLVLVCANIPLRQEGQADPWLRRERLAWTLIGCGCLAWGIGECFWRYYLAHGQTPFPSLADVGYSSLPPLFFAGLLSQPFSRGASRRVSLLLDSLIAMGALLSIAWFLLLGALAQTPAESALGKFLGLYYATADVALLSCTIFLLLRSHERGYQAQARRIGLLVVAIGISIFAASDFLFNVLNNVGLPVDGTWVDLGWPLGMMTVGVAAYLRRFLPESRTGSVPPQEQEAGSAPPVRFGLAQAVPYLLVALLFLVLAMNVLSSDLTQQSIRLVLIVATLIVVGLVITRQIVTLLENGSLIEQQARAHAQLEAVYQDNAKSKAELEAGVTYLKEIQTRLANGDVRARARALNGDLWPLAHGLNLMADRMLHSENSQRYAQAVIKALDDLSQALERVRSGGRFILPVACHSIPELSRLVAALGVKGVSESPGPIPRPEPPRSANAQGAPSSLTQQSPPAGRQPKPAKWVFGELGKRNKEKQGNDFLPEEGD